MKQSHKIAASVGVIVLLAVTVALTQATVKHTSLPPLERVVQSFADFADMPSLPLVGQWSARYPIRGVMSEDTWRFEPDGTARHTFSNAYSDGALVSDNRFRFSANSRQIFLEMISSNGVTTKNCNGIYDYQLSGSQLSFMNDGNGHRIDLRRDL